MSRLNTMARFDGPDEKEPKVIDYCYSCNAELYEGEEVVALEDFLFCDIDCLFDTIKYKTLEENKYGTI